MKRFLCGAVWFVVFYFGSSFAVGFIVGFQYGLNNPHGSPSAAGAAAQATVTPLVPYLFYGSIGLAVLGTLAGILPGTGRPETFTPDWPREAPRYRGGNRAGEPQSDPSDFRVGQQILTSAQYLRR